MKSSLQRAVATFLTSLYLLVAVAGQALHVPGHADNTCSSCCCEHGCCPSAANDSADELAWRGEPICETDAHECAACSLLAEMRLADGATAPRLVALSRVENVATPANDLLLGTAIYTPFARGPPHVG